MANTKPNWIVSFGYTDESGKDHTTGYIPTPVTNKKTKAEEYNKVQIPEELRWKVFKRDGFKCMQCGSQKVLQADHITPESKGGKAILDNLQTLCRRCNSIKGAR